MPILHAEDRRCGEGVAGVDQGLVKVMFNASKVKLSFDEGQVSIEDIEQAITRVGYEVQKTSVR